MRIERKDDKNFRDLENKIISSNIFMLLGTSNYLKDLKNRNSVPYIQSMMAKRNKKPVLIVFLKGKIKEQEKIDIERFYSSFNVVKEIEIDFYSDEGIKELSDILKDMSKKLEKK